MGSARVQYELERTLTSLQLAATHGLFSKDVELRSITQRRRQFENALVRRHALVGDYIQYIQFEEELEKLRVLRVTRLKDQNEIPRHDMIKMQKEAISHIVSIFERGVKRLKFNFDLWKYYITWAHSKKMRVVVSRVSARALALFPNKVELWLLVANHELNDYQSASTARALLQRGLRLNGISHPASIAIQAAERPKKKARRGRMEEGEPVKSLSITPAGNEEDDRATMIISDKEQDLIRIWIEYIRMELVFLERLRRRRIVLGISGVVEEATEEVEPGEEETSIDQVPINNEGEAAPPSLKSMKEGVEVVEASSSESLLMGAIPKSALRSAISLQSATSLPPRAHFAFLLALASLVRTFPFYSDTEGVRTNLLNVVQQTIQDRFPSDPNSMLLLSASSLLSDTHRSELERIMELELKEELQEGNVLRKASNLSPKSFMSDVDSILHEAAHIISRGAEAGGMDTTNLYLLKLIKESLDIVEESALSATHMKTIIDSLRRMILELDKPLGSHFAFQLRIISFLEEYAESKDLAMTLKQYFRGCSKRVISDAKKVDCNGVDIVREEWRAKLYKLTEEKEEEDDSKTKVIKIESRLWEACEQYPKDETLLLLYAEMIQLSSKSEALSAEEVVKRWSRIQNHEVGKKSVSGWSMWADWVMQSEDKKWKLNQLQNAISKTVGFSSTHELLLKRYLSSSQSKQELMDRLNYIEKRAYPQASLWRWTIDKVEALDWEWMKADQSNHLELLTRLYTKLIQSGEDVEDYGNYLEFLMLEANDPAKAMEVFRDSLARLSKEVGKRILLEEKWEQIRKNLRDSQVEGSNGGVGVDEERDE